LDDSDFDLMVDIEDIGNILFQGFEPPVDVVFFSLPAFDAGTWDIVS
jgi:hypothetical protein